MSFDTRVRDHIREAGDRLTVPPADLAGVVSRGRRKRMTRILVSGVVVATLIIGGAVLIQALPSKGPVVSQPTSTTTATFQGAVNGWVAFAAGEGANDIYLVREGEAARRIIGSDSDGLEQVCPAFSPDGGQLAYGQARGTADVGYSDGLLVVAGLDQGGNASTSLELDVGVTSAPPCPLWSPDGQRIAFAVHSGDRVSVPQGSAREGDVWIVSLDSGETTVLAGLFVFDDDSGWSFPDMDWSPDGAELAVANVQIFVYSTLTDELRPLNGTQGADYLTWSPDGTRIAYQVFGSGPSSSGSPWRGGELRMAGVEGIGDYLLAGGFEAFHGIGPVWSPDGDRIVYQRVCSTYSSSFSPTQPCREEHDVVLVNPDGSEVVLPHLRMPGTSNSEPMWPNSVAWSPDGQQLLYQVWGSVDADFIAAVIAMPLDPGSPPVVLHGGDSGYVDDDAFGFQSWGREPEGQ